MSDRHVVLWDMPGPWPGSTEPDPDGFRDVVTAALTQERRAQAGPLHRDDIRRHTAASIALERIARLRGTPIATISAEAIGTWRAASPVFPRVAAGFYLPGVAAGWLRALSRYVPADSWAAIDHAANRLQASGHGLVLSPEPVPKGIMLTAVKLSETTERVWSLPNPAAADAFRRESPTWTPFTGSAPRLASANRLWRQLADAVRVGEPLPVGSTASHEILAEVLRSALDVAARQPRLRVLYMDGSEAEPFPLYAMRWSPRAAGRSIRLGLMSMRHTEMDADVDGYWFRNRLVSTSRTLAETDAFCAAETVRKLRELRSAGITCIELLHTGFEPAAIGFYRGLLRWLEEGEAGLTVQPVYLMGRLVPGTPWGLKGAGQ